MKLKKKSTRKRFSAEEIDKIVEAQAKDDSAWGKPINVCKIIPAKQARSRASADITEGMV